MGAAPSGKEFLSQPSEELRFRREDEERMVADDGWLERSLRAMLGTLTWKFSSWSQLASSVDADQARFAKGLQDAIDPDGAADADIVDVRLVVLAGKAGVNQLVQRSGILSMLPDMTPRISTYLDHNGNAFATFKVQVNDVEAGPLPRLPTLDTLGIGAKLRETTEQAEAAQDSYVLKLCHSYCAMQFNPPVGQFFWTCDIVALTFRLAPRRHVVLQLSASEHGADGSAVVSATNLAGDMVFSRRLGLHDTDAAMLLTLLASHCQHDVRIIRLVSAAGAVVDYKTGSACLADLLAAGGGS